MGGPQSDPGDPRRSGASASGGGAGRELPPETYRLLSALAAAAQKHAMYPPGHPALAPTTDELLSRFRSYLRGHGHLTLTAAPDHLTVGGVSTDPDRPLPRSLAERLHAHDLRAVTFRRGLGEAELGGLLAALASDPERDGSPLGRTPAAERQRWDHIVLEAIDYDPLRLGDDSGRDAADLYDTEIAGKDLLSIDAGAMARNIEQRMGHDAIDRMVAVQLFRLARQLREARDEAAEALRTRMSETILRLDPDTLQYLLWLGEEGGREREFLMNATSAMTAESVILLVKAAAESHGKGIAPWLLRLLSKLAMYGPDTDTDGPGPRGALQRLMSEMMSEWELEDPRPGVYDNALHRMSRSPPAKDDGTLRHPSVEPDRMLKMGLELDADEVPIRDATERLLEEGRFGLLLALLESAPRKSRVAAMAWSRLATPDSVRRLLESRPPDLPVLDAILERAGDELVDPLLDILSETESRSLRRQLFDRIVGIGAPVTSHVGPRLEDERWYVRRNMLALLTRLPTRPEGFSALDFLGDPDPRVRAEAFKVALQHPRERETAICRALRDGDPRLLSLAMASAEAACPREAEPMVAEHVLDEERPDALRVTAVRALAKAHSSLALETLLRLTWSRHLIFWRRLAPPSPVVLEALEALAAGWPRAPETREVLQRAAEADDERVRAAVKRARGPGGPLPSSPPDAGSGRAARERSEAAEAS